eukprot:GFUD01061132.1.p1 GENE.GFUD01061132.1~~GFUD01061132.1.p1  ORF type:complete len:109 (-),score=1.66 GFUD01061132.1:155-481(-)
MNLSHSFFETLSLMIVSFGFSIFSPFSLCQVTSPFCRAFGWLIFMCNSSIISASLSPISLVVLYPQSDDGHSRLTIVFKLLWIDPLFIQVLSCRNILPPTEFMVKDFS